MYKWTARLDCEYALKMNYNLISGFFPVRILYFGVGVVDLFNEINIYENMLNSEYFCPFKR